VAISFTHIYILEKGEIFSFNRIVGPADKDDGYLETKVVVNGKLVPGYGGGVCQVSSTLYNALLQCDAKIIERSSHSGYSETTSYVEPGLDAAVSFGYKDLKFSFPQQRIAIFTYVDSDRLVAEIWGEKEFSGIKSIMSQIQSITDNGDSEAFIEVETTVLKNDIVEKRYKDRYLIPKEYAETLKEQIDKNQ
jgi:vancomycin resistance protein YoaR